MHGQSMACSVVETVTPSLPATAFTPLRINAPEPVCLFYLLETFASKRPFARPQRLSSFENHRGEVNAPALSLRRNSKLFLRPVRLPTPILICVRHATGIFRAENPLPSRESRILKRPSSFHSPSGLSSLGIEALGRWLISRSLPSCSARFPFAPRKRHLVLLTDRFRIIVPGSLLLTRLTAL